MLPFKEVALLQDTATHIKIPSVNKINKVTCVGWLVSWANGKPVYHRF
jgi:hypothetical protein